MDEISQMKFIVILNIVINAPSILLGRRVNSRRVKVVQGVSGMSDLVQKVCIVCVCLCVCAHAQTGGFIRSALICLSCVFD